VRLDEAVALLRVKPLDRSFLQKRRPPHGCCHPGPGCGATISQLPTFVYMRFVKRIAPGGEGTLGRGGTAPPATEAMGGPAGPWGPGGPAKNGGGAGGWAWPRGWISKSWTSGSG